MIDKLEFLLASARERHFGRAAKACRVTQPTLSAGLKQLEDTLDILLVTRGSRFQNLAPEGERVLDWAKRIVGDVRMRKAIVAQRSAGGAGLNPSALKAVENLAENLKEMVSSAKRPV